MGSLGWVLCYWCWHEEYNMRILDFIGGIHPPLCEDCLVRLDADEGPPWKPDAIGRQIGILKLALRPLIVPRELPEEVYKLMAEFLKPWAEP